MIEDSRKAYDECLRHYSVVTKERDELRRQLDEAAEVCDNLQQRLDAAMDMLEASVNRADEARALLVRCLPFLTNYAFRGEVLAFLSEPASTIIGWTEDDEI